MLKNLILKQKTFYAIRNDEGELIELDSNELTVMPENAVLHGRFVNDLTYSEIEIIIA